jgi:transposase
MERRKTPDQVASRYGVSKGTVITWCESGVMPAVNVASPTAKRKRYRMSDEDMETFDARRANKPPAAKESKSSRRTIARPTKDYFAKTGGGN